MKIYKFYDFAESDKETFKNFLIDPVAKDKYKFKIIYKNNNSIIKYTQNSRKYN